MKKNKIKITKSIGDLTALIHLESMGLIKIGSSNTINTIKRALDALKGVQ